MGDRKKDKKDKKDKKAPPVSRGKVLGAGDTFYFGPKGAWEGPTPSGGCMVYKVTGDDGCGCCLGDTGGRSRQRGIQ